MSNEMMFWLGAVAMVIVALLFLLPPLFGRGQQLGVARRETNLAIFQQRLEEIREDLQQGEINEAQFEQAEAELKRELLADLEGDEQAAASSGRAGQIGGVITLLLVPLIAFVFYGQLGEPEGLNIEHAKSAMAAQQRQNSEAFVQTVAKLEQKLQQEPSNLEGWMMLAKSYRYLGQSQKVVGVYERALQQSGAGENPQLLLDYGEALAEQRGGDWRGEPIQQLNRALALDPTHNDALWLAGHIHFDQGEYEQALGYWERLSNVIPSEDPEIVEMINQAGFKAQQKLGRLQQPLMKMAEAVAEMVLTVSVSIDSALQEHVEASDTVFIYAKAAERGGPPLAAQRLTVADLPVTIRLDDSMAMIPGNNLSSVERVTVGAKVSKSGVATGGSGDLVGSIEVLTSQQEVVELTIDQRVE